MKYIITTIVMLFTLNVKAQLRLEAKAFAELRSQIEATTFTYKETGKMFGFDTTQSCMFKGQDLVVFRNYCFPVRAYPAQGYTIISKEFGIIELYEENLGSVLKRDIHISEFASILSPYLEGISPDMNLAGYSSIIEKMYRNTNPGCWSTNYSYYIQTPDANCSINTGNVFGFDQWAQDSQVLLNNESEWMGLMKTMNLKFPR
jgi:hypothetical protein